MRQIARLGIGLVGALIFRVSVPAVAALLFVSAFATTNIATGHLRVDGVVRSVEAFNCANNSQKDNWGPSGSHDWLGQCWLDTYYYNGIDAGAGYMNWTQNHLRCWSRSGVKQFDSTVTYPNGAWSNTQVSNHNCDGGADSNNNATTGSFSWWDYISY